MNKKRKRRLGGSENREEAGVKAREWNEGLIERETGRQIDKQTDRQKDMV